MSEIQTIKLGNILNLLADYTANGSFESLKDNVTYYNKEDYAVLVRTTDLGKKVFKPERFTDKQGYDYLKKTALYGNEILIANVGTVGKVYKVPKYNKPMTLAPNMYLLKFDESVHEDFIYYILTSKKFQIDLFKQLGSTTLLAINKDNLRSIEIQIPKEKKEQEKIAEILSEVDSAIDNAEAYYEKNRKIKIALMQDLLTHGIDEKGKIRNPKTHQYKDSPLGDIPVEWDILELNKLGTITTGSTPSPSKKSNYYDGIIPFVSPSDIQSNDYVSNTIVKITEVGLQETREISKNSIMTVCIGSTIGKMALLCENGATNQQINSLFCHKTYHTKYVFFSMMFSLKEQLRRITGLQAVPIVNKSKFEKLVLSIPKSKTEQKEIAKILSSQDEKIEKAKAKLEKLKSLKTALMQDLLSGTTRVNHLLGEEI